MLPALETGRLTLHELAPEDAPEIQVWQNSPTQWRQMAVEPAEFSDAAARIANYQKYRGTGADRRLFVYAARLKSDGTLVGSVSLARSHPGSQVLVLALQQPMAGAATAQSWLTEFLLLASVIYLSIASPLTLRLRTLRASV